MCGGKSSGLNTLLENPVITPLIIVGDSMVFHQADERSGQGFPNHPQQK